MMKRDITFDICRSICMLWVVCVWHLRNYVPVEILKEVVMGMSDMTIAVLATFTYISGYFLRRYVVVCPHNVLSFYKARVKRFVILFFAVFLLTYFVTASFGLPWTPRLRDLFMGLTGLSLFFGTMPLTFWYLGMLMVFYLITPFFMAWNTRRVRLMSMGLIYLLFWICSLNGYLEPRVL